MSREEQRGLKEWETARKVIAEFDDRLHDLRKTGFGFVTGLLTAQSLLVSGVIGGSVPDFVKVAVIWVTFVLVGGLRLAEKNYRFFQQAASMRAKVIERRLNLELTETIADKYQMEQMWRYVDYLYLALTGAAGVLGIAVVFPNLLLVSFQVVVSLGALLAVLQIGRLSRTPAPREPGDWTFSPSECQPGGRVRITLTNLEGPRSKMRYSKDEAAWRITKPDGSEIATGRFTSDGSLEHEDDYEWVWHVPEDAEDLYLLQPVKWPRALKRKIMVTKDD